MAAELSLSVVVPVKDDAVVLARCLQLIRQQTLPPAEIVVVDNDSRDGSAQVAARYGATVLAVQVPGIPAAAAAGYDAAVGTVIARCDADSAPPPDWLERIQQAFATDPSLGALVGTGYFYDLPRLWSAVLSPVWRHSYLWGMRLVLGHPPLWGSNMALRRSAWQEVRTVVERSDPEVHDDLELSFWLGPQWSIRYDGRLRVGVSPRCLYGLAQIRRRWARTFHTVGVHWAIKRPWARRRRRKA
jgi:glycosyltransferase involved in cell wall biosynthesis